MKLIKCHVEGFGTLSGFDQTFGDGITVISEENGFGKTTLAVFIKTMLYGMPDTKSKDITKNDRVKYLPWQGGAFGGYLIFEVLYRGKTRRIRIDRKFGKKASEDEFSVTDAETGERLDGFSSDLGQELFGIDADAFSKSIYLPQERMAEKQSGTSTARGKTSDANTSITTKLTNLLEQSDDLGNFVSAKARLDKLRLSCYTNMGGGEINRIGDIINKKTEDYRKALADSGTLKNLENEISVLDGEVCRKKGERERLAAEIKPVEEAVKKRDSDRLVAAEARKPVLEQLDVLKRKADMALEEYKRELLRFGGKKPDRKAAERLSDLASEIARKQSELEGIRLSESDRNRLSELEPRFDRYFAGDAYKSPDRSGRTNGAAFGKGDFATGYSGVGNSAADSFATGNYMADNSKTDNSVEGNFETDKFAVSNSGSGNAATGNSTPCGYTAGDLEANTSGAGGTGENDSGASRFESGDSVAVNIDSHRMGDYEDSKSGVREAITESVRTGRIANELLAENRRAEKSASGGALYAALIAFALIIFAAGIFAPGVQTTLRAALIVIGAALAAVMAALAIKSRKSRAADGVADTIRLFYPEYTPYGKNPDHTAAILTLRDELAEYRKLRAAANEADRRISECKSELSALQRSFDKEMAALSAQRAEGEDYKAVSDRVTADIKRLDELCSAAESAASELAEYREKNGKYLSETESAEDDSPDEKDRLSALKERAAALGNEISEDEKTLVRLKTQCESLSETAAAAGDIAAELELYKEKREGLHKKYKAVCKAIDYLDRAKKSLSERYLDPMRSDFNRLMEYACGSDTDCGEALESGGYLIDTGFNITSGGSNGVHIYESFSRGYKDLMDVCLHIALADALFRDEKTFIILDDPFANLDERKLKKALDMLERLSRERQIIYFICHDSRRPHFS